MTGGRTRATCLEDRGAAVTPPPQARKVGESNAQAGSRRPPRFQRGELAHAQTFQSGTGGSRIPNHGSPPRPPSFRVRGSGASRTRKPVRATPLATELLTIRIASLASPARVERAWPASETGPRSVGRDSGPKVRIELTTSALPWRCSATELPGRVAPAPRVERGSCPSEGRRQVRCCGEGAPTKNRTWPPRFVVSGPEVHRPGQVAARPGTAQPGGNALGGHSLER